MAAPQTVLVLMLGDRRIGLPIAVVDEVLRAVEIAPLPGAPRAIDGVIDVRGELVPVFDPRVLLGLPPRTLDPSNHLVLARAGNRRVALRADRVTGLTELPTSALRDPRAAAPCADHVTAIAQAPEGLVLVEDLAAFLEPAEFGKLDAAIAAASPATGDAA